MMPAKESAITASSNLTLRTSHGVVIIGPTTGFPRLVRSAGGAGGMAALAALRAAPDGFDAIRRWPRRFDLMPGASTASDGQIIGALESGIAEQRLLMLYVADNPPPAMFSWSEAVARRAPAPRLPAGAAQTEAQTANAAIAALSATDKVLAALEKGLRGLGDTFGELVDQFLEPENLLKVGGFLLATALVGLAANTNPISAAIFDGAMVGFVYYSAGRLGVESLMLMYEAIVSASNATTTAEIDTAGKDLSKAIIGLGGAVFLGWLARRLHLKAKARVQARQQPPPQEQLPPARVVPREGTPPTQSAATGSGARFGTSTTNNYKKTFFDANPATKGKVVVHHAVEQQVLERYPGVVTESEMNSLANLRGIPNELNSDLHLSKIRIEWNRFYKPFDASGTIPTKAQLLQKAAEIDSKFGSLFNPPVGGP